jgi:predicted Zn-dependent protease
MKENIYDLISEKGVKYTVEYVAKDEARYAHSYGKAWLNFREGKIQESKNLLSYLEKNQPENTTLMGNCRYLRGHIALYEMKRRKAIEEFKLSIEYYEQKSIYENMFHAYLGIAVAQMDIGNMVLADEALQHALTNFKITTNSGVFSLDNVNLTKTHKKGIAQYYMVRKRYELITGNLPAALINAENSLIFYETVGSINGQANALSDIGFIHMLTGHYDHGWKYTLRAQSLIMKLEDEKKYIYNQLNVLIYLRCNGLLARDYNYLVQEIEKWIVEYHDNQLNEYLQKVLTMTCEKGEAK